jgi:hypothetical protein
MGEMAGNFQFVSMGRAGQPTNANDRKTIRKAAMLAFRRQERIERVKAFAAEHAVEVEAKAAISPAVHSPVSKKALTRTNALSPSGPMVRLAKPELGSRCGSWLEDVLAADRKPTILPQIPLNLGLPDLSCADAPDTAYVFDYCTYTRTSLSPPCHVYFTIAEFGQLSLKLSLSCYPSTVITRE